jgi:hypothetical protein
MNLQRRSRNNTWVTSYEPILDSRMMSRTVFLPLTSFEHGRLFAQQPVVVEGSDLVLVAYENHVEVVDLLSDHAPLVDPPQALHDEPVDGQAQGRFARSRRRLGRGMEGEVTLAPTQTPRTPGRWSVEPWPVSARLR